MTAISHEELVRRAARLRWLMLDVDGVLTDGRLVFADDGEATKTFHVRDGLGIQLARAAGLEVAILSGRRSAIVERRARELGIVEVIQGETDKLPPFEQFLARRGIAADEVTYVGDDLPDLPVLARCGVSAAPRDAVYEVRAVVDLVLEADGGRGAVRELVERLLSARGTWPAILARFGSDHA